LKRALILMIAMLVLPVLSAQDQQLEAARTLIERIEQRPERAWDYAFSLRSMVRADEGGALLALFEEQLESRHEMVRLVCAQLVLSNGNEDLAWDALGMLLESESSSVIEAVANLAVAEFPEDEEFIERLRMRWEEPAGLSGAARVALSEALYLLDDDELALEQLREFVTSPDHELMNRAALVLAQRGHANEVGARIRNLEREPGDLGRLARIGARITDIDRAVEAHRSGAIRRRERLMEAQIRAIQTHYVDEHLVYNDRQYSLTTENLLDSAARAMAGGTDAYGAYLTAAEIEEMEQDQQGRYVGIGAHVSQGEDGRIRIDRPIYEGPAYAAGVRSGDELVAVLDRNGNRVELSERTLEEGVQLVRGPAGSTAVIFVRRRGVDEELRFEIKRQEVRVNTALGEMLPGGVGYVRLTRFGSNTDTDLLRAMNRLRREGMEQLVLDLRGNSGGQLSTVVNICDMLLPRGATIAVVGGRWGEWARPRRLTSSGGPYNDLPLVVLIDGDSASGSEMLAGAIKDNNRGLVIGRPSFGKGTGQTFFPVTNTGGSRVLKVTVFTYYLPSGVSIDTFAGEDGVVPDVVVHPELLEPWQVYAIDKLRSSGRLLEYVDRHYRGDQRAELMRLAGFDGRDHERWPGFEEFYTSLDTRLSRDDVRRELRAVLRSRVQDDRGAEFTQNFQEDHTLLRGIEELLKTRGKDIREVPEYRKVRR
jgi:carboxyl-terminal processing protease